MKYDRFSAVRWCCAVLVCALVGLSSYQNGIVFALEAQSESGENAGNQRTPVAVRIGTGYDEKDVAGNRLTAPFVEVEDYKERLQVSWDTVKNASGYEVEITSGGKVLERARLSVYETYYTAKFQLDDQKTYLVRVKALAEEAGTGYADSAAAAVPYKASVGGLAAPKALKLEQIDEYLEASWQEGEGDGYRVILSDPDGKILVDETVEGNFYYFDQVKPRSSGRYTVRVRAVDRDDGWVSKFASDSLRVENSARQLKAPVASTSFSGDSLEVSWEEVEHAKSYTLRLRRYGSDQSYLVTGKTTTDTSYTFENIAFKKGNKYVVEICANAENGYKDSDYEGYSTKYFGW